MITYTKMFEKVGTLPFETQHYIEKIDWDTVQKTDTQRVPEHKTIRAELLDDGFGRNVKYFCEHDLNLKLYQANISMVPPGSLTPMHTNKFEYIRKKYNLILLDFHQAQLF